MGQIPLYGVTDSPQFDFLAFEESAAQQGTFTRIRIGPIVTAGLLMLLKGSELISLNFKDPDDRSLFTSATKIVTIIVIIAEGALYGVSVYGGLLAHPSLIPILIGQLIGASIVDVLDELIQKGWGLGSGISLFIMAGVAQGILWSIFSPLPAQDGPVGVIPFIIHSSINGDISDALFRSGQFPSFWSNSYLRFYCTRVYSGYSCGYTYSIYKVSRVYCCISYKIAIRLTFRLFWPRHY